MQTNISEHAVGDMPPKLPIYLLVDCSESMIGEGIEAISHGMQYLIQELKSDPYTIEKVWLSVITFSNTAAQLVPLTEILHFQTPQFRIHPATNLGAALTLLLQCIQSETRPHTPEKKGDLPPLVFILTDGEPTDIWERAAYNLKLSMARNLNNLIAIGCGPDVNSLTLQKIADQVLLLHDYKEGDFKKLFLWIYSSISAVSQRVDISKKLDPAALPLDLLKKVSKEENIQQALPPLRQLFISAYCSQQHLPYLIRFHLEMERQVYIPVKTYLVDKDYFADSGPTDAICNISANKLEGLLPCPRCGNSTLGKCPCGTLFCCSDQSSSIQCPICKKDLEFSQKSGGDIFIDGRPG
jgi:uncharacterized protein YegL